MRTWTIVGLEGLCDDNGFCEPYTASEIVRKKLAAGEIQSEAEVEEIAARFHCRVEWKD